MVAISAAARKLEITSEITNSKYIRTYERLAHTSPRMCSGPSTGHSGAQKIIRGEKWMVILLLT